MSSEHETPVFDNMRGLFRELPGGALAAKDAVIVGDVRFGEGANVWFHCVIRGDDEPITIGPRTNVQDGSILHVDFGYPCVIGADVTIGHKVMIHGCEIEDGALIGMGALLLNGCKIGRESVVGAGAVVPEGMVVPPRSLVVGIPAKVKKEIDEKQLARMRFGAEHYVERARNYL